MANIPKLPPSITTSTVKSTASSSTTGLNSPLPAVDWWNTSTGGTAPNNAWRTSTNNFNGAKINIDFGTAFAAVEVKLWNYQTWDENNNFITDVAYGFRTVKVYGSNSSTDFNNTTLNSVPANGTLLLDTSDLDEETEFGPTEQAFEFTNTTEYRYYIVFFTGTWGATQGGIRVVQLLEAEAVSKNDIVATLPSLSFYGRTVLAPYYPPALNATYVKSTPSYPTAGWNEAFRALDGALSRTGTSQYQSWLSSSGGFSGSKINADYVDAFACKELHLWNFHDSGTDTTQGVSGVRLYGSNSATDFDNITAGSVPASGTLLLDTAVAIHSGGNVERQQIFVVNNSTAYRYYVLYFTGNRGHLYYGGIRQAQLLGPPPNRVGDITVTLPSLSFIANTGDGKVKLIKADHSPSDVQPYHELFPDPSGFVVTSQTAGSLTGPAAGNTWEVGLNPIGMFAWDSGVRGIPHFIDIENYHDSGSETDRGVNAFQFYGSNSRSDFDNVEAQYGTIPAGATLIHQGNLAQHVAADTPDQQRVSFTNTESYRYFIFVSTSNHGDSLRTGLRRITAWGDIDTRLIGDIEAALPSLNCEMTAPIPELVGSIAGSLRAPVVMFSDGPPPAIAASIKPMTAFFVATITEGPPVGIITIILPSLTFETPEQAWGHISATLPGLEASMLTAPGVTVTLPAPKVLMTGRCSIPAALSATMPPLDANMMRGASMAVTLPKMGADMTAIKEHRITVAITLPPLSAQMTATRQTEDVENDMVVTINLPRLSASLAATVGRAAALDATMPRLGYVSSGIPGKMGAVAFQLPSLSCRMTGDYRRNDVAVNLPMLDMEMEAARTCAATVLEHNREAVQW